MSVALTVIYVNKQKLSPHHWLVASEKVLNLDQKIHGKVSVAVIVMPQSIQGFINEQKLLPP